MLDIGPYYLTAFVHLLGPINSVMGQAAISFPERTITAPEKYGQKIKVEIPTHVTGMLNFKNGVSGTLISSFDVWDSKLPLIEVYGSEGTLSVPNPNNFGGAVHIKRQGAEQWSEIPLTHGFTIESRGMGLADMAYAIHSGRQHRANGDMAFHVLDAMIGFQDSSDSGKVYTMESTCDRPAAVPSGFDDSILYK